MSVPALGQQDRPPTIGQKCPETIIPFNEDVMRPGQPPRDAAGGVEDERLIRIGSIVAINSSIPLGVKILDEQLSDVAVVPDCSHAQPLGAN